VRQDVCTARQCSRAQNRSPANQSLYLQTRRLWEAIHSARKPQGRSLMLAGVTNLLTGCSHIKTSSTLQPSNTSQPNSPPSILEIKYLKPTRNSGSTLRRSTRTPTKGSKVAGRTGGYQPRRLPHPHTPHLTPRWHRTLCIGVTRDYTSRKAALTAAGTLPCPLTQAIIAPSTTSTSMHLYTPATNHKSHATMTWAFTSAKCIRDLSPTCTCRDTTVVQRAHG
jgi:hypothetical protein